MKPSEIIREGMKHVEAGYCKGKLENPGTGEVCTQGALRRAIWGNARMLTDDGLQFGAFMQAVRALDAYARDHGFISHTHLNDYGVFDIYPIENAEFGFTPTTKQDVLTMMEKSAIVQEEIGQ